jgi:peptidoglycan hydrolase-like protein with peptidoglycan-binding domain
MTARPTARPLPLRALALAAASVFSLAVFASSCGGNTNGRTLPPPPTDGPAPDDVTAPTAPGEITTTTAPPPTVVKVALSKTLQLNDQGDEVKMVQQRLNDLNFDVGAVDGIYGANTQAAVWAYQDLTRDPAKSPKRNADGKVSPDLWSRMQDPINLTDWRPNATPRHVLISLPGQFMIVWNGPKLEMITHISSGSGEHWCAEPKNVPPWPGATTTTNPAGRLQKKCGESVTPGGKYRIYLKQQGKVEIPLGTVFDPLYFNKGIAIHGFDVVPFSAASHGCVRVPRHIGTRLNSMLQKGDQVFVWDGAREPEANGAQEPPGDFPDPNDTAFIDATSTTTTTVATTTTAPTTTVATTVPTTATTIATTSTAKATTTVVTTATTATTVKPTTTVATTAPTSTTTVPATSST